jgi:hypothetical protein
MYRTMTYRKESFNDNDSATKAITYPVVAVSELRQKFQFQLIKVQAKGGWEKCQLNAGYLL